jgi:hypothetical protein
MYSRAGRKQRGRKLLAGNTKGVAEKPICQNPDRYAVKSNLDRVGPEPGV